MKPQKPYGSVIKVHARCWQATNDYGYAAISRRSKAGALRLARSMHPGRPIRIFERGAVHCGRAELRLIEEIPAR